MLQQEQKQLQLNFAKALPNASFLKNSHIIKSRNEFILLNNTKSNDNDHNIYIYDLISCSLKYTIKFSVSVWMEYVDQTTYSFRAINIATDETRPDEAILLLEYQNMRILTKIPIRKGKVMNDDCAFRLASWRVVIGDTPNHSTDFRESLSCDGEGKVYTMFSISGKPRGQVGVFDFDCGKLLGVFDFDTLLPKSFGIYEFRATRDYFYMTFRDNVGYLYIRQFKKQFPIGDEFYTKENSLTASSTFDEWDFRGCHCKISHIIELEQSRFVYRSSYSIIERTNSNSAQYVRNIYFDHAVRTLIHYDTKRKELYCSDGKQILVFKYPYITTVLPEFCNKLREKALNCSFVDIQFNNRKV